MQTDNKNEPYWASDPVLNFLTPDRDVNLASDLNDLHVKPGGWGLSARNCLVPHFILNPPQILFISGVTSQLLLKLVKIMVAL
jgi:hypothetical protein